MVILHGIAISQPWSSLGSKYLCKIYAIILVYYHLSCGLYPNLLVSKQLWLFTSHTGVHTAIRMTFSEHIYDNKILQLPPTVHIIKKKKTYFSRRHCSSLLFLTLISLSHFLAKSLVFSHMSHLCVPWEFCYFQIIVRATEHSFGFHWKPRFSRPLVNTNCLYTGAISRTQLLLIFFTRILSLQSLTLFPTHLEIFLRAHFLFWLCPSVCGILVSGSEITPVLHAV